MRKKILIIENSVHVTGALNAVLRTSVALKSKYDFVFVLPLGSPASAVLKEKGFDVFEIPMLELSKRWSSILFYSPNLIRSAYLIRKIVKQQRIALVHVNDFYNLIMPLWRLCGGSTRYVCHVNFVPDRFPVLLRKFWIASHLKFSSKIIAVSNHVRKQLPISDKIVCIPNALPDQQDHVFERHQRKNVLLFIGNFMKGKGQDLAIQAFASIAKSHPDWTLRFVGSDMGLEKNKAYHTTLINTSKQLGIEKQVEWKGFSKDVSEEYRNAAIALNFSTSESFSLTVQEAMFYGCPAIATRSGGPEELIEDKYSGLLIPLTDINAMREAMGYLIENPDERLRIGNNAATSIRATSDKINTIDQLDLIYDSMINANILPG
jgi:glycosyltransferase involved in cell wall biosynthesis